MKFNRKHVPKRTSTSRNLAQILFATVGLRDSEAIKDQCEDLTEALYVSVIRQAVSDAMWIDTKEGTATGLYRTDHNRIDRQHSRIDAMIFFIGGIIPDADGLEDVEFGEEKELLTLELVCRLAGWEDPETVRMMCVNRIMEKSQAHNRLMFKIARKMNRLTVLTAYEEHIPVVVPPVVVPDFTFVPVPQTDHAPEYVS